APASKATPVPLLVFGASYQGIAFLSPTRVGVGLSCNLYCKPLNLSRLLYHTVGGAQLQNRKIMRTMERDDENCFIFQQGRDFTEPRGSVPFLSKSFSRGVLNSSPIRKYCRSALHRNTRAWSIEIDRGSCALLTSETGISSFTHEPGSR